MNKNLVFKWLALGLTKRWAKSYSFGYYRDKEEVRAIMGNDDLIIV